MLSDFKSWKRLHYVHVTRQRIFRNATEHGSCPHHHYTCPCLSMLPTHSHLISASPSPFPFSPLPCLMASWAIPNIWSDHNGSAANAAAVCSFRLVPAVWDTHTTSNTEYTQIDSLLQWNLFQGLTRDLNNSLVDKFILVLCIYCYALPCTEKGFGCAGEENHNSQSFWLSMRTCQQNRRVSILCLCVSLQTIGKGLRQR